MTDPQKEIVERATPLMAPDDFEHHGPDCRTIVWEHNTHVGDARATDMHRAGMVNVGQLVRERRQDEGVFLVGFGGHGGSVIAADRWGAPGGRLTVPPAPTGTHEDLLHAAVGAPALGVVYHPSRDHFGNWVPTVLGQRYDAFISLDDTTALHPLVARPVGEELETYPWSA